MRKQLAATLFISSLFWGGSAESAYAAMTPVQPTQTYIEHDWIHPGSYPFIGTAWVAKEILARRVVIPGTYERVPPWILEQQFAMWRAGECNRRAIQRDEYFGNMLFGPGFVKRHVRARTEVWVNGTPLGMTECIVIDYERLLVFKLQRPDVCGNWAYSIAPLLPRLSAWGPWGLLPSGIIAGGAGTFGVAGRVPFGEFGSSTPSAFFLPTFEILRPPGLAPTVSSGEFLPPESQLPRGGEQPPTFVPPKEEETPKHAVSESASITNILSALILMCIALLFGKAVARRSRIS